MSFKPSLLALSLFASGLPIACVHADNPIIQTRRPQSRLRSSYGCSSITATDFAGRVRSIE